MPAPATAEPVAPAPVQSSGVEPRPGIEEEIAEPTAEELAVLNEPGQRALKAERDKRKAARAKIVELESELAKLRAPAEPAPKTPEVPAAPATPPNVSTPSVATPALADCHTFEAIEARSLEAAKTEAQVVGLQNVLQYQGPEAVVTELAALGVTKIGETAVAEAKPEQLAGFLATTLAGTRMTQLQVEPRKRFIVQQAQAYQQAVKVLPELQDKNSAAHKQCEAFVQANPQVKANANWPLLVAKLWLGEQQFEMKLKVPAAASATRPTVIVPAPSTVAAPIVPALRPAPGAPARSASALPQSNRADELSGKITAGTATLKEVDEYSALAVGG